MAGILEPYDKDIGKVAVAALKAGCDVLMFSYRLERACVAYKAVKKAIASGELSRSLVEEKIERVKRFREEAMKGEEPGQMDLTKHEELIKDYWGSQADKKKEENSVGQDAEEMSEKCVVM